MRNERSIRLSLSGFLFEDDYAAQSLSLEAFCCLANECGYAGVELRRTQIDPDVAASRKAMVKQLLHDHGLCLTALTLRDPPPEGPQRDLYLTRYLDLCLELGCPLLKVSGSSTWLNRAVELAQPYGVRLATNNHIGCPTETIAGTDALLKSVASDSFGLLFDPMHLLLAGEDVVEPIARWAPRIVNVLFQCARIAQPQDKIAVHYGGQSWSKCHPDAHGAPPWHAIAPELFRSGYDGWITVVENTWPHEQRTRVAAETADFLFKTLSHCGWETSSGKARAIQTPQPLVRR